ncbi:MAG: hypothetical protein L0211_03705 [Planctomycetaceae bacterium]|nr:hypothetical protein [Planctomycetaceae bacterium]
MDLADLEPRDANPVVAACITGRQDSEPKATAGCWEHAESKPEYERFRASFCLPTGIKLTDVIERDGLSPLRNWLHFESDDAEPKAFIRLMLALADRGESFWDQPGISLFLEGRWSQGGGPSPASDEALAILAHTLGKPIKLFFIKKPGDPLWVNTYEP